MLFFYKYSNNKSRGRLSDCFFVWLAYLPNIRLFSSLFYSGLFLGVYGFSKILSWSDPKPFKIILCRLSPRLSSLTLLFICLTIFPIEVGSWSWLNESRWVLVAFLKWTVLADLAFNWGMTCLGFFDCFSSWWFLFSRNSSTPSVFLVRNLRSYSKDFEVLGSRYLFYSILANWVCRWRTISKNLISSVVYWL